MALSNNPTQLDVVKAIKDLEKDKLNATGDKTISGKTTFTNGTDETVKINSTDTGMGVGFGATGFDTETSTAVPAVNIYPNSDGTHTTIKFPVSKGGTFALEEDIPNTEDFVTTTTEQTITAQKTHDANIMLKNNKWLVNEQGRNIICKETTSGNQTSVGNTFDKTVIASSSRPSVRSGLNNEEMAFISDIPTNAVTTDTDQTISGIKTFSNYIKTPQVASVEGKGLVRYKETEGKSVYGNDSTANVLMGNTDRPYYSKSGSDFTGVEVALKSDVPTKISQLTNDSGYITNAGISSATNYQPSPNHTGTATTPPNNSLWTPTNNGWVMFSCTSHANGSSFYLKLDSSTGLMVGCSLGTGGGKMNYNNCPSMTVPVQAGKTYYVYYSGYSAHYYSR